MTAPILTGVMAPIVAMKAAARVSMAPNRRAAAPEALGEGGRRYGRPGRAPIGTTTVAVLGRYGVDRRDHGRGVVVMALDSARCGFEVPL